MQSEKGVKNWNRMTDSQEQSNQHPVDFCPNSYIWTDFHSISTLCDRIYQSSSSAG